MCFVRYLLQEGNITGIQMFLSHRVIMEQTPARSAEFQKDLLIVILLIIIIVIHLPDSSPVVLQDALQAGTIGAVLPVLIVFLLCERRIRQHSPLIPVIVK